MALKFLYIDDESEILARGLIKQLEDRDSIQFDIEKPLTWNKQKYQLIDNAGLNNYDGLLLDFKLQFSDDKEDSEIKYSGAELAQSIRNGAKSGAIKDLPIFLCSTEDFYIAFFDRTSKDLFDVKYKKEINLNTDKTRLEMISYAKAYSKILECKETEKVIDKNLKEYEDIQILNTELGNFQTAHEWMYLLNHYFIQTSGLLIDEELLAIRLGIDISKSPDWGKFKSDLLTCCKYNGVLGEFYLRWWQFELNNWWNSNFNKNLMILNAADRVEQIKSKFGYDLSSISLLQNQNYSTFWYKCRLSNTPLDSTDGLRTIEMPRYVWQDPTYISLSYLLSDERDLSKVYPLLGPNERQIFEELDQED